MQQHVERIYDLVFISLFNTILGALRVRERAGERKRGSRERERARLGENERQRVRRFNLHVVFLHSKDGETARSSAAILISCLAGLLAVIILLLIFPAAL